MAEALTRLLLPDLISEHLQSGTLSAPPVLVAEIDRVTALLYRSDKIDSQRAGETLEVLWDFFKREETTNIYRYLIRGGRSAKVYYIFSLTLSGENMDDVRLAGFNDMVSGLLFFALNSPSQVSGSERATYQEKLGVANFACPFCEKAIPFQEELAEHLRFCPERPIYFD